MKKIVLLAMLIVFGITTNAQTKTSKKSNKAVAPKTVTTKAVAPKTAVVDGPGMVFENDVIDYGTIPHNSDGKREFVFTNNGNKPLIIESTQGSCGCTVPTKPTEPILPGQKGVIGVKYATDRVGQFTKNVTVKSNATGQETKIITIKGNVLPDETKPAAVETVKS